MIAVSVNALNQGNKYIGVNLGLFDSVIVDSFTRELRRRLDEKNTFEDAYKGQFGGIYFGYRLIDKEHTFINLQAHVNVFNKEFSIETSSSTLIRKLDYSLGIDLQPGFYIKSGFLCFFNFSIERGKFKFSKEGTSTTYDVNPPVLGYGFGAGIGYEVSSSICLKLQYQYNQYSTTEILSTLNRPKRFDSIELSPRYDIFLLSLQYNFK